MQLDVFDHVGGPHEKISMMTGRYENMTNEEYVRNFIADMGKKKFLAYGRNFCHFHQKLFILAISAAHREN